MESNEIHAEIRASRDALMKECAGDLARFDALCRASETRWASAGHPVVSFEGQAPLELPPVDWKKVDARPENEIITEIRATRRAIKAEADALLLREEPPEQWGSRRGWTPRAAQNKINR